MAGGWPFFFMMAEEAISSGMALGYGYGKGYWRPILQAEKALKDKLDKLKVGINTKGPWFDGREMVWHPFPYAFLTFSYFPLFSCFLLLSWSSEKDIWSKKTAGSRKSSRERGRQWALQGRPVRWVRVPSSALLIPPLCSAVSDFRCVVAPDAR